MYVYGLIDPQSNCFRYIGITNDLEHRYSQHLTCSNSKNFAKDRWIKSLRLQGLKPTLVVLEECEDGQMTLDAEARWIQTGLRIGWPLLNSNKVELSEYPNKISIEVAEWLLDKHKDKLVDHLVDALLDELRPKKKRMDGEISERTTEQTDRQRALKEWRAANPGEERGMQTRAIRELQARGIDISKSYVCEMWDSCASPMAWQQEGE